MSALISAAQWAIDQGAKVINMSIGAPGSDPTMRTVIDGIFNAGAVPVAAIGNFSNTTGLAVQSPGDCPNSLGIGAVYSNNTIASFSCRGPARWDGNLYAKPDISGPGVNIYSTFPLSQGSYGTLTGTSMATPHLSGVIAMLLQANPNLTATQIKTILMNTATLPPNHETTTNIYGAGIVNAWDAMILSDQTLPSVVHTPLYHALANQSVLITTNFTDNVSRVSVPAIFGWVYYRYPGQSFQSTSFTNSSGSLYSATIPTMSVSDSPSVDYYLLVRDLNPNNLVRVPSTGFYRIGLKDTDPPVLRTTIPSAFALGRDVMITANIIDQVDLRVSADLYYRVSMGEFTSMSMQVTSFPGVFSSVISGALLQSHVTLNYYFNVWDSSGNTAKYPANAPIDYFSVEQDTLPPSASFLYQDGDVISNKMLNFQVFDNVGVSTVDVFIDGQPWNVTLQGSSVQINGTSLSEGNHSVAITLTDFNQNQRVLPPVSLCFGMGSSFEILGPTTGDHVPLNYPNPFNPEKEKTTLAFRLSQPAEIEIGIYNLSLKRIQTLRTITRQIDLYYELEWDGKDREQHIVSNGIYFYVISATTLSGKQTMAKGKVAVLR